METPHSDSHTHLFDIVTSTLHFNPSSRGRVNVFVFKLPSNLARLMNNFRKIVRNDICSIYVGFTFFQKQLNLNQLLILEITYVKLINSHDMPI